MFDPDSHGGLVGCFFCLVGSTPAQTARAHLQSDSRQERPRMLGGTSAQQYVARARTHRYESSQLAPSSKTPSSMNTAPNDERGRAVQCSARMRSASAHVPRCDVSATDDVQHAAPITEGEGRAMHTGAPHTLHDAANGTGAPSHAERTSRAVQHTTPPVRNATEDNVCLLSHSTCNARLATAPQKA